MKMTLVDKSEMFRAFLLLIGRDGKIAAEERETLLSVARILDLDRDFADGSIRELLENRFISTRPPRFSRKEFAESFLKDAIGIAFADDEFHKKELDWLKSVAEENVIAAAWLEDNIEEYKQNFSGHRDFDFRKHL